MNADAIDAALVRRLIASQFPAWARLPVSAAPTQGWDNRTFRLGEELAVRLPSAERYAAQVEKERAWLPRLAPLQPVAAPLPVALGEPDAGYPWRWSVYRWIAGEPATTAHIGDRLPFARNLARFLKALQAIDATGGPPAGPHSFFRGGSLATYDSEVRQAIERLTDAADARAVMAVWDAARATEWRAAPVWVHGDVAAGNILVDCGELTGVIDFGCLSVGDPACDLTIAWTFMGPEEARVFRDALGLDDATWARGRAWALWKALILSTGLVAGPASDVADAKRVLREVLLR